MKINLAKSAGFCFGVQRALDISLKASCSNKKIYLLGDIVHNETVVRQLREAGIKKISRLSPKFVPASIRAKSGLICGKDKTLLIRAHGCAISTIKKARALGYKIIDATCPMVKEIHRIAKTMEQKGYTIVVIGDKNHDEVKGIVGQLDHRAIIIDKPANIPVQKIKTLDRIAIVVQSTQNTEEVLEIVKILRSLVKKVNFFNTICLPTRTKQKEIRQMAPKNDIMIIIGSKTSANTKRLFEISCALNKNSFWISSAQELNPQWFKGVKTVGLTAGASTPSSLIGTVLKSKQNCPQS